MIAVTMGLCDTTRLYRTEKLCGHDLRRVNWLIYDVSWCRCNNWWHIGCQLGTSHYMISHYVIIIIGIATIQGNTGEVVCAYIYISACKYTSLTSVHIVGVGTRVKLKSDLSTHCTPNNSATALLFGHSVCSVLSTPMLSLAHECTSRARLLSCQHDSRYEPCFYNK